MCPMWSWGADKQGLKNAKRKPAKELGGGTEQSLLSVTELLETQLAYQEMTASIQWPCVESFFIFAL